MKWLLVAPGYIVESLICFHFWSSLLEKRFSKEKTVIIFSVFQFFNMIRYVLMFDIVSIKAAVSTVFALVLMHILYKGKFYKKIIVQTVNMVCVICSEFLALVFAKYLYHCNMVDMAEFTIKSFVWQGTVYLFIFVFNTVAVLLIKNKIIKAERDSTQFVFLYIAIQCLILFMFAMLVFEHKVTSIYILVTVVIVMILSAVVAVWIYKAAKAATAARLEAEFMKEQAKIKDRHFRDIKEQYVEYRRLKHDFANHLKVMGTLNNSQKVLEYADEIKEKLEKIEQQSFCDNLALDALLTLKNKEAERAGINISYEICSFDGVTIPDFDMCTIMSNLLDNAIDACHKTSEKRIKLHINRKLGRLIVMLKNSSLPVNEDLNTSKTDRDNHGIGVHQIKAIAEKYDGEYVYKYSNSEFVGIVSMSVDKNG